jgi:hypothetical protein
MPRRKTILCPECGEKSVVGQPHVCFAEAKKLKTYRYRDPKEWRKYMRHYMRDRRARLKGKLRAGSG